MSCRQRQTDLTHRPPNVAASVDERHQPPIEHWHPWAERTVRIHEVIERRTGAVARCSLAGATVARVQEIPVWDVGYR